MKREPVAARRGGIPLHVLPGEDVVTTLAAARPDLVEDQFACVGSVADADRDVVAIAS